MKRSYNFIIRNIALQVHKYDKIGVLSSGFCGVKSLFEGLIGELDAFDPRTQHPINCKVGYLSFESSTLIPGATILENILFGQ